MRTIVNPSSNLHIRIYTAREFDAFAIDRDILFRHRVVSHEMHADYAELIITPGHSNFRITNDILHTIMGQPEATLGQAIARTPRRNFEYANA